MKIIFMGTPDFAVPTLTEIVSAGHEVVAVYTRAPKPAGRGQAERKSPIHLAAEGFGIPVRTPKTLRNEAEQAAFAALEADDRLFAAINLETLSLTMPGSLLDMPGVAMPSGVDRQGLPTSVLFSVQQGHDDRLLRTCLAVESALLT